MGEARIKILRTIPPGHGYGQDVNPSPSVLVRLGGIQVSASDGIMAMMADPGEVPAAQDDHYSRQLGVGRPLR